MWQSQDGSLAYALEPRADGSARAARERLAVQVPSTGMGRDRFSHEQRGATSSGVKSANIHARSVASGRAEAR